MSGNIAQSNGPFVIGYTLCFGLMGVLAVQAYTYFTRFSDDRKVIKGLGILLLELTLTVSVFYAFWESSTTPGGQVNPMSPINPVSTTQRILAYLILAPITGLITTLTHDFYCWRIWIIRRSLWIPTPVMLPSLVQLANIVLLDQTGGLGPGIYEFNLSAWLSITPFFVTWLCSSAICDLTITICMLLTLRRSNAQFSSSKSMLTKLTRLTIETGFITTVAAFVELVLGAVFVAYMYHIAVFYAISKLYANCLLASLNFRLVLRSQSDPNTTLIVWEDGTVNAQLEAARSIPPLRARHVEQLELVAPSSTDEEGAIGSNEAIPANFKLDFILDQSSDQEVRG